MTEHTHPRPEFPIRPGLTLWFGSALLLWVIYRITLFLCGEASLAMHLAATMPAQYMLCVCIHDGVHGVLTRSRAVNQFASVLLAMGVLLPFPLLQRAHLFHHRHVDDPEDPEHIVYSSSLPRLLFNLPMIPWYYLKTLRLLSTKERVQVALIVVTLITLSGWIAWSWSVTTLFTAWLLPSLLTIAWFGFTTVYIPHSSHQRFFMRFFTEHSGWHHDHHRAPQYPFNQYIQLRDFHLRHDIFEPRGPEASIIRRLASKPWAEQVGEARDDGQTP